MCRSNKLFPLEKSTKISFFSRTDYLKCLLPRLDDSLQQSKRKEPYAPSSELNVEGLRNMSLVSKITAILSSASVVKYSQLITLLGNKAEKDSIISCLKQLAVLVRGCWVLSSEKLYPDNSVSSACGVSAPLMRRGRDYILWKMNRCGYVMRKEMCSHTKVLRFLFSEFSISTGVFDFLLFLVTWRGSPRYPGKNK